LEKSYNIPDVSLEELIRIGVVTFYILGPVDNEYVSIGLEDYVELAEVCVDNPRFKVGIPHIEKDFVEHLLGV
jgi:hypothetical protein